MASSLSRSKVKLPTSSAPNLVLRQISGSRIASRKIVSFPGETARGDANHRPRSWSLDQPSFTQKRQVVFDLVGRMPLDCDDGIVWIDKHHCSGLNRQAFEFQKQGTDEVHVTFSSEVPSPLAAIRLTLTRRRARVRNHHIDTGAGKFRRLREPVPQRRCGSFRDKPQSCRGVPSRVKT
jgi:hypothetical protein